MPFWDRKDTNAAVRGQVALEQFRASRAQAELVSLRIEADLQKNIPAVKGGLVPQLPKNDPYAQGDSQAGKVRVELPYIGVGQWAQPAQVLSALAAHDIGNFRLSGLLQNALLTDPAIRGPLDIRTKALTGKKMLFKPVKDTAKAKEIADYVTAHFREWLPCEEQERFMRTRLLMGASLAQTIWTKNKDKMQVPEVNCWEAQWIFLIPYDNNRNFGRWQVITIDGTIEPVAGDRQWVWAKNTVKDPQLTGLIRSLGLRFIARLQSLMGLGKYQQRYALAILKLKQPATFDEADTANIQSQLQFDASPIVTLPQGDTPEASWDLEWEAVPGSQGYEVFLRTLSELKAEMAIDILGQTLTSDTGTSGGGAKALGQVHDKVRGDLRLSDEIYECSLWREQLLKPFTALNYGDPDLAPLIEYESDDGPTLDAKADALNKLGTFLTSVGFGVQPQKAPASPMGGSENAPLVQPEPEPSKPSIGDLIDVEALLREYGVPLKSDSKETEK